MVNTQVLDKVYQFVDAGIIFKLVEDTVKVSAKQAIDDKMKIELKHFILQHDASLRTILASNNNVLSSITTIIKHNNTKSQLSFAQERLWFIDKLEEGTEVYNIPLVFELVDRIDLDLLEESLRSLLKRHEVLRTLIKTDEDGSGYQHITEFTDEMFVLEYKNVLDETELKENIALEYTYFFKLDKEYPIRATIYRTNANKHYLSLLIHHVAFDGWSTNILIKDSQTFYSYYLNQADSKDYKLNLPELKIQYKDFAIWQRVYLSGARETTQLRYWQQELLDFSPLNLITDKLRPSRIDYSGANIFFELDLVTSNNLRELAKSCGVSLYSVLLSAYYIMLSAYSNQNDIVIGNAVANRHYDQVENLIGFFVNSLALRIKINSKQSIKEFIKYVGEKIIEAQLHQDLPFERLVEELKLPKDISRHPIFQVIFGLHSFEQQHLVDDGPSIFKIYQGNMNRSTAKYDLSAYVDDLKPILKGFFNYRTNLYVPATVERFVYTYKFLLEQISLQAVEGKEKLLIELQYLNKQEYHQVIYGWNETRRKFYPENKTIQEVFEEQVLRTPDNIAIIYNGLQLTYRELNEEANNLAHYLLQEHKIQVNDFIALYLDRSEKALVAILAILKAGAAYVPLNPDYPDDRITYVLEDTKAKIIITYQCYHNRLESIIKAINLQMLPREIFVDNYAIHQRQADSCKSNPVNIVRGTNLAYVIYTSGTTGKPKGVMVEHNAVLNYIYNLIEQVYTQSGKLNIDYSTNIAFDLSVSTTLGTLLSGNTVCIYDGDSIDINSYIKHLLKNKINLIKHVPSYFEIIVDNLSVEHLENLSLSWVILGGEKLSSDLLQKSLEKLPIKIYDEYGPTETTVGSHIRMIDNVEDIPWHNLGRPYSNYTTYVLDANQIPLPIGAVGELYIGGIGVARGYLNKPEITRQKFIVNPFQGKLNIPLKYNEIIYKTGDLVRYLSDGTLEYFNRDDTQVKINGYRIELGEIESMLSSYPGITKSTVLVGNIKHNFDLAKTMPSLVGYYVAYSKLNEEDILNYLANKLPNYMLPSILVYLEELPLTSNGKLDIKALPEPQFCNVDNYVAPRDEIETKLAKIWSLFLGIELGKIGIDDNFFSLGGNSILAIKLISKMNETLQSDLKIISIFSGGSIRNMSTALKAKTIVEEGEI